MAYDLVIRGGTVVDGTGAARRRADVAISGERIVAIGEEVDGRGAQEIDADGHIVAPGFVDGHTHLDAQMFWDPYGTSPCWHGVTSVVMGNCGFTLAPCAAAEMNLALRSLERAEDMSRAALLAGIDWRWETFPEYLDVVDALPKGINVAAYVGHSTLRTYVMGERAFTDEATADDLDAMCRHLTDGLRAGAAGFSTSRSHNHETSDDRPVASRLAAWDEVRALVGVLGTLGVGTFEIANEHPEAPEELEAYWAKLGVLAADVQRPVTFMYSADRDLGLLDELNARGGDVFGSTHAREFLSVLGFRIRLPFDRLPVWADVRTRSFDEQLAALHDPVLRERLVHEAEHGTYRSAIGAEAREPDYATMRVYENALGPNPTVASVAAARGTSPVETMIDLALESDLDQLFAQPIANFDLAQVRAALAHPRTVVAASDSGAHVSQLIDSSIPTYLLAHWVREEEAMTWEQGVRALSGDPAARWGFTDRGVLREGAVADIVVFDPATVGPEMPEVVADFPADTVRLVQRARGIAVTVVAGEIVQRDGEHSGATPGRLLRGPLASG